MSAAPLFVLGVRRSGTTLLRVMLDRHPALAIPDESYFIPQLADRHRGSIDVAAFVETCAGCRPSATGGSRSTEVERGFDRG